MTSRDRKGAIGLRIFHSFSRSRLARRILMDGHRFLYEMLAAADKMLWRYPASGTRETMKRILFVDDEPHLLEGLQRMLRTQRREWQMSFANGGEQALSLLEAHAFDVIVTDMRMPQMD